MVDTMAAKGLVMDLDHHGERYVALAPVVIGFFEFTFMRVREDAPMEQLAELFHEYMYDDESFAHAVFRGSTQIGRSLVREECAARRTRRSRSSTGSWPRTSSPRRRAWPCHCARAGRTPRSSARPAARRPAPA